MVYSRVTTSSNALRPPVYLRRCHVSLMMDRWEGRGETTRWTDPLLAFRCGGGLRNVLQNTISKGGLWNNGHELSVVAGGALFPSAYVARLCVFDCCQTRTHVILSPFMVIFAAAQNTSRKPGGTRGNCGTTERNGPGMPASGRPEEGDPYEGVLLLCLTGPEGPRFERLRCGT